MKLFNEKMANQKFVTGKGEIVVDSKGFMDVEDKELIGIFLTQGWNEAPESTKIEEPTEPETVEPEVVEEPEIVEEVVEEAEVVEEKKPKSRKKRPVFQRSK